MGRSDPRQGEENEQGFLSMHATCPDDLYTNNPKPRRTDTVQIKEHLRALFRHGSV